VPTAERLSEDVHRVGADALHREFSAQDLLAHIVIFHPDMFGVRMQSLEAASLSQSEGVACEGSRCSPSSSYLRKMVSRAASCMAVYSPRGEESATERCLRELQEIIPEPRVKQYPPIERLASTQLA
jgi:hypothetical protein